VHNFIGRRLYAIIDLSYIIDEQAPTVLRKLIDGGIDVVQLRGKTRSVDELSALAGQLLEQTLAATIPFIINDQAAVANRLKLQGVHVGQEDDPIAKVRAAVNRPILVGKSTLALVRRLRPSAKEPITLASVRSSQRQQNQIINRLGSTPFRKCIGKLRSRFFASVESTSTIYRESSMPARIAWSWFPPCSKRTASLITRAAPRTCWREQKAAK